FKYFAISVGEMTLSSPHCAICGCNCFVEDISATKTPAERRHVVGRITCAINVCIDTDYSTCVEHRVDACFTVIAHDESAEGEPCAFERRLSAIPKAHRIVCILHVRCIRVGTEVAPFTEH